MQANFFNATWEAPSPDKASRRASNFATVWLQLRWPLEVPPTPQGHCWQLELRDTQVSSKPWQHPPQQDSLVADPHRHHLGSGQWRYWHGNPGWTDFENLGRRQYHVLIILYIYIYIFFFWWQGTCHWLAAPKSSQRVWHVHDHVYLVLGRAPLHRLCKLEARPVP